MGQHNHSVRKVLSVFDGEEVRHTGKGIFARFAYPDNAICAAIAIQKDWDRIKESDTPLPSACVAVVGSSKKDNDPAVSDDSFSHASTLCLRYGVGHIACDTLVLDACDILNMCIGDEFPNAHSAVAGKGNAVEILWNPLPV